MHGLKRQSAIKMSLDAQWVLLSIQLSDAELVWKTAQFAAQLSLAFAVILNL